MGRVNIDMTEKECVGILGCGAMGLLFAARFLDADREVVLVEKDPQALAALQAGFVLEEDGGRREYRCSVGGDVSALAACDVVFVWVKSGDTKAVADSIQGKLRADGILVSLQNGIGNADVLRYTGYSVVAGTTAMGATRLGLNSVRAGGLGETVIGSEHGGAMQKLAALLEAAGFPLRITKSVEKAIWEKAVINAAINPLGALLGLANGQLPGNPGAAAVQKAVVEEAVAVAAFAGVQLDSPAMCAEVEKVCRATAGNRCSMLQDLDAGRFTEIEAINGYMVSLAAANGKALPVNETLCQLVHAREQTWAYV